MHLHRPPLHFVSSSKTQKSESSLSPIFFKSSSYPLIVQPLAPYMVLVRHIFTTLQYTFKTLQELFRHNKHVLLLFY